MKCGLPLPKTLGSHSQEPRVYANGPHKHAMPVKEHTCKVSMCFSGSMYRECLEEASLQKVDAKPSSGAVSGGRQECPHTRLWAWLCSSMHQLHVTDHRLRAGVGGSSAWNSHLDEVGGELPVSVTAGGEAEMHAARQPNRLLSKTAHTKGEEKSMTTVPSNTAGQCHHREASSLPGMFLLIFTATSPPPQTLAPASPE